LMVYPLTAFAVNPEDINRLSDVVRHNKSLDKHKMASAFHGTKAIPKSVSWLNAINCFSKSNGMCNRFGGFMLKRASINGCCYLDWRKCWRYPKSKRQRRKEITPADQIRVTLVNNSEVHLNISSCSAFNADNNNLQDRFSGIDEGPVEDTRTKVSYLTQ